MRIFPSTITPDGRKIPLIKDWAERSSENPEDHRLWKELFKERLTYWSIPTGKITDLLVLDVDIKGGGHETIKQYPIPETRTQRTISGGTHYFFRYPRDGKVYGNRVRFLPGLDTRGDGGYVVYYGADNTPIADAPQWLCDLVHQAPQVPANSAATIRVDPSVAEGIIQSSLEAIRQAPEGERNNTLNTESFKVAQLVASQSIPKEYAEQILFKAAIESGLDRYESWRTIQSAIRGGAAKPLTSPFGEGAPVLQIQIPELPGTTRWTPAPLTMEDILDAKHLRKPQLFENWSTEDITITTADGGTGKTTLKLFEAVSLALGNRFLGFNCISGPGKTLFITGEDTAKKLAAITGVIIRQMGLFQDFPGFPEKVKQILDSIVIKKDADLCLITKDRSGFIYPNMEAMRRVMEAVEDVKPKMIVFDPISSFWGSESMLNDMNKAVTKWMSELAERSNACVEMINHMGKQSSATKDMSQFAGRGGSGLPSNARVSRVMRPIFEEEFSELTGETLQSRQSAIMCVVNKFTDGSPLYNKPFLIVRDGYIFSRKNLTDSKQKEAEKSLTDAERVFQFVKEARENKKWPTQAVCIAHFITCGDPIGETKVKRALSLLQYDGHLGERLKQVENPDMTVKDRVFVITDMDGRER